MAMGQKKAAKIKAISKCASFVLAGMM